MSTEKKADKLASLVTDAVFDESDDEKEASGGASFVGALKSQAKKNFKDKVAEKTLELADKLADADLSMVPSARGARPLKPNVAPALNIGPKLKVLRPSPDHLEMSPWESMLTTCVVKDLKPGFVVIRLDGESFEKLPHDAEADMFVVTTTTPCVLKDVKTDTPVCIRNPDQSVHVLNSYGLGAVDPKINDTIYPIVLSAPFLYEKQQTALNVAAPTPANKASSQPKQKPELIFNFMGFVWGTNDPKGGKWMAEVGTEVKEAAKEAITDAKEAAKEAAKDKLKEALTRKAIGDDTDDAHAVEGGEQK